MLTQALVLSLSVVITSAWPDGAPCVHAAFESMNPLEAVEHQGGLQLTPPPYEIKVDQNCYWRNQPIALTLQGLNESIWFKGFVIQPYSWNNDRLGSRIGQIVRLDDNGSWQQQCFTKKDSATHSHNEKKKHMRMWWKVDAESDTVQFVATVVKHQTMFWVKSVLSKPIPPCRVNRNGYPDYTAPLPTQPPPVKHFKMETNQFFGNDGFRAVGPFIVTEPTSAPRVPSNVRPVSVSPRLHHVIPVEEMHVIHPLITTPATTTTTTTPATTAAFTRAPAPAANSRLQPVQQQRTFQQQQQVQRQRLISSNRRIQNTARVQPRPAFTRTSVVNQVCEDRDNPLRCQQWLQFCRSPRSFAYLSVNCRRTCRFC